MQADLHAAECVESAIIIFFGGKQCNQTVWEHITHGIDLFPRCFMKMVGFAAMAARNPTPFPPRVMLSSSFFSRQQFLDNLAFRAGFGELIGIAEIAGCGSQIEVGIFWSFPNIKTHSRVVEGIPWNSQRRQS